MAGWGLSQRLSEGLKRFRRQIDRIREGREYSEWRREGLKQWSAGGENQTGGGR